ncbi:outer membrane lipoprotein-sorting protein [Lewinella sp. LCG006]|uniref:outer membrane lipoprotein-sorting protein n=1 Tax=Lewinella sp. LCG006 TaxID=3231911 RepID=UPI0034602EF7
MKNLMKFTSLLAVFVLSMNFANAQDAAEIIRRAEDKLRGASSYSEMKMTVVRPDWSREVTLKSWSVGTEKSLILITGPARDKGVAFLKRDQEIWNWQPTIDRSIKMPPSMMMQSWMGSDFTNDDLVRESSILKDYNHRILGEEMIGDRKCWKIELQPKPEAAVVWGKIQMWIDKTDYLQLKTTFYDEDDYLVNTMQGKAIKQLGGKLLPSIMEVIPAEEEGHKTILEYITLDFNVNLKDDFFSVQNMKRVR